MAHKQIPRPQPKLRSSFVAIGTARAVPPTLRAHANVTGANAGPRQRAAAPWDAYLLPKASPRLAVYPPRTTDPEVKYDVRSARGGRGGIVTSVAALWASATAQPPAQEAHKLAAAPAKPPPKPAKLAEQWKTKTRLSANAANQSESKSEPSKSPPPGDGRPKMLRTTAKTATSSPTISPSGTEAAPPSVADLTARRARMIKSASVPAVVSSSLATPMISSTASLARPAPAPAERHKLNIKLPPTISESTDSKAPASTPATSSAPATKASSARAELAFGQARLRELIKRYQGQVNS
ncbi:hypothetical protein ONZ51_g3590 [Trametes cubensis]|uniref:Uncharacterized protein n=1 Tax=Trametes cubensis TaxID=1111947 RepID=A0AAD7TXC8_9APHY|nr:hypothetical protein ONZ51_g3590 [Trametes cubensis]